MGSQYFVFAVVAAIFVAWLRSKQGRDALKAFADNPIYLLPPLLAWGATAALNAADLGDLDKPFWELPFGSIRYPISITMLLHFAVHVTATSWLIWLIGRRADFGWIFLSVATILLLMWAAIFALFAIAAEIRVPDVTALIAFVVVPMGVVFYLMNLPMAPLASTLSIERGRLMPAMSKAFALLRNRGWRRFAIPVFLRLLMSGAIVVIWLSGYSVHKPGVGNTTTDSFSFNVKTYVVLNLSVDNGWYSDLVDKADLNPDPPVHHIVGAATALVSALFLVAFALIPGPCPLPPPSHESPPPIV